MALLERRPAPPTVKDVQGTVWEPLTKLAADGSVPPFVLDAPSEFDAATLAPFNTPGYQKVLTYKGSGSILEFNMDLPTGFTLSLQLDGQQAFYSHGNESGIRRWLKATSPYKFDNQLVVVITNTTGTAQTYLLHLSGA